MQALNYMRVQRMGFVSAGWLALALLVLGLSFGIAAPARAATEVQFWHAMPEPLGTLITEMTNKFNTSQDKYKVVPTYKGTYTENMNQAIAAFRAGKHPHLLQVFEVGTQTMMLSGAIYPVHQLMADQGYQIDWASFIQPVISYYVTPDNKLLSMPFNSSTPIFYYNKDQFAKAGLTKAPATWDEVAADVKKLRASGQKCAFTTGWQSWTQIENFSALHNIAFASANNGFDSLGTHLQFNNPKVLKHIKLLESWAKDGSMSYEGRTGTGAEAAFNGGKCSMMMDSSAAYAAVSRNAKFAWAAAPMPVEKGTKPLNSIIGGATLWVLQGHPKEDYAAVAAFLNFVASPDNQVWWHQKTGYLPITQGAYDQAKKSGYYNEVPTQEIGIKQLTRAKPTKISRGLRLGNFVQIRTVIDEEMENVWGGKKTAQQGLDDAVRRGDELLRQFEELQKKS